MPLGGSNDTPPEEEEKAAKAELEGLSLKEVLEQGQVELLRGLVAKVKAGTASHQEAAILRNLLRDNGMVMGAVPPGAEPLRTPVDPADLPRFGDPDYERDD